MSEASPDGDAAEQRFLTYRMGERLYAIAAETVAEIIRTPPVARVPRGPKSLLGIANLRGAVLPIASLRGLLGQDEIAPGASSRAIVLAGGAPVGLAVDAVEALVAIDAGNIQTRQTELAAEPGERLCGAFQPPGGSGVAKILDVKSLIEAAFTPRERPQRMAAGRPGRFGETAAEAEDRQRLVTFEVAGQAFALPLEAVREIVPIPETVAVAPRSEALVLGMTAYRGGLLPLLSMRGLLGLGAAPGDGGGGKVVVTAVGGALVGLVVERMRAIVAAEPGLIEPTPAMLAARTGGEPQIAAIYRGDGGARLTSILAPEKLFREDVMTRLARTDDTAAWADARFEDAGEARQFLIFRLGENELALPIEAVDEVAQAPSAITRLPKTPDFLEGVINLRGEVLPVVDQRRRFDMPAATDPRSRRLIVVRTARHRAGLIVDAVREVLRVATSAIEPAPDLAGETTRLVSGVINLEGAGRMLLVLDPAELLTRTERGLLDAFQARTAKDQIGQAKT